MQPLVAAPETIKEGLVMGRHRLDVPRHHEARHKVRCTLIPSVSTMSESLNMLDSKALHMLGNKSITQDLVAEGGRWGMTYPPRGTQGERPRPRRGLHRGVHAQATAAAAAAAPQLLRDLALAHKEAPRR